MELQAGQTLGDYEILGPLGSGGMGTVYKVRSTITQRIEAIKILLPSLVEHPELAERFLREIRISAGLDHPNIASLRAAQRSGDRLLMVMEYVEGATLGDLMRRARLPLRQVLDYISQSLTALEYAHSRGIIHRDIKPGNIMVTPSGQVKLMDFGVAKLSTDHKLTKTGFLVGSLHYMSPEQIEGKELDQRSDLYSLGVTFYEMLTGARPFTGDSEYQIMAAHLKGTPQPPRELDPAMPASVNDLVLTSIARDTAARFASAKAMKAAVDNVLQQSSLETQPAAVPSVKPAATLPPPMVASTPAARTGNHRAAYLLIGLVVSLAVLVAAIEIPHRRPVGTQEQPKRVQQTLPPVAAPTPSTLAPVALPPPKTISSTPTVRIPAVSAENENRVEKLHQPITRAASSTPPPQKPVVANNEIQPMPVQQQPNVNAGTPAADTAAIEELRDRMLQMDARVAGVRSSLDSLRSSQAQSGLTLRSDMVAAEQLLLNLMNDAAASLRNGDAASARKRLDSAETQLGKLESFLGR